MKQRFLYSLLAFTLCLVLTAPALAASPTFTDVPTSHWAYECIEKAATNNWVSGMGNSRFNPDGKVTGVEFSSMLVQAFYVGQMQDVLALNLDLGSEWWRPSFTTLNMNNGFDYIGASNEVLFGNMTRLRMAHMLYNVLINMGVKVPNFESDNPEALIPDWNTLSAESRNQDAVYTCYKLGLISGMADGSFNPSGAVTRAQSAVVLCRLNDIIQHGNDNPKSEQILANGKPVTDENITDILTQLEQEFPTGTGWGGAHTPDGHGGYIDTTAPDNHWYEGGGGGDAGTLISSFNISSVYGCGGFAAMVSDRIFGKEGAPVRVLMDHTKVRPGDLLQYVNINTGETRHWGVAVTQALPAGERPTSNGGAVGWPDNTFFHADGNLIRDGIGYVEWPGEYSSGLRDELMGDSEVLVIYTRYQDELADSATLNISPGLAVRTAIERKQEAVEQKLA